MRRWRRRKLFRKFIESFTKHMIDKCRKYCYNKDTENVDNAYKDCVNAINDYILFYSTNLLTFLEDDLFRENHYEVIQLASLNRAIIDKRLDRKLLNNIDVKQFTTSIIGSDLKNISNCALLISKLAFSLKDHINMWFLKRFTKVDIKTICKLYYSSQITLCLSVIIVIIQSIYSLSLCQTALLYLITIVIIQIIGRYINSRAFEIDKPFYTSVIENKRTLENLRGIVGDIVGMNERLKSLEGEKDEN